MNRQIETLLEKKDVSKINEFLLSMKITTSRLNGALAIQTLQENRGKICEMFLEEERKRIEAIPLEDDQCENTIESESMERLKNVIFNSFKTERGIIMLENDLLLYKDIDDKHAWVNETCKEWKEKLNSKDSEEFCEALYLWNLAQIFQ